MRWLSWGELLVIQLIAPETSFLGHLAGILVGLAYVAPPHALRVASARLRRQARRAWSGVVRAFGPAAPEQQQERRRRPAPPPPAPVLTAEELRALHVARFSKPAPKR